MMMMMMMMMETLLENITTTMITMLLSLMANGDVIHVDAVGAVGIAGSQQ